MSFPPNGKNDLYQSATPIQDQNKKSMTVGTTRPDQGPLPFGGDQLNGQFAMPKDVWFTMGAVPIRSCGNTSQFGNGGCVRP